MTTSPLLILHVCSAPVGLISGAMATVLRKGSGMHRVAGNVFFLRMIVRGGVFGAQRIARHLWRMCLAMLMATLSFYPGQAEFFPSWLRHTNLLYVPHVLLSGAMLFWLVRVSVRKRVQRVRVVGASHDDAIAMRAVSTTGAV
jgi:hypothetical protein